MFKPHKCEECGEAFAARYRLNYHMRKHQPAGGESANSRDRIKCPKCPRTFVHKQSLQRHAVKHSGEKPFKCDSCEASYKYAWDLTKHKKREHSRENADEDWIKMETVEFRDDDAPRVEPEQLQRGQ